MVSPRQSSRGRKRPALGHGADVIYDLPVAGPDKFDGFRSSDLRLADHQPGQTWILQWDGNVIAIYNSCISTCNRACQVGFGSWLTSGSVERQWSSLEFQRTLFR